MNCSPAGTQLGKRKLIIGADVAALVTGKSIAFEVPPPGAGLVTVTAGVPVEATLEAGMVAVNCVELTKKVAAADPPKLILEAATKFVPLIVSPKLALPATVPVGEIEVIVGVGFRGGGGCTFELLPPQLARPDAANNKKRAHIAREKALSLMSYLHI
ncbi:MAG TPA: hypothetical protein VN881_07905 [Candidatus Acidoferrales bacterium]|nr:hypothetical protein [Candidatus Acidoferrales bacterium]